MEFEFSCNRCKALLSVEDGTYEPGEAFPCPECGATLFMRPRVMGPGTTIAGFRIKELIGEGAMGHIFLAHQASMDRDVALKLLPRQLSTHPDLLQRFQNEIRNTARLEHPNIVRAYEAGEDNGLHFLAMEYIRGETLDAWLQREGTMVQDDALRIVRILADALEHAWEEHHLIHQDIKPGNVLLDLKGDPHLADMGISQIHSEQATDTTDEALFGTPNYVSPEQVEGLRPPDNRSDIYSLGATLHHMLTGVIPFEGLDIEDILVAQVHETLPDPRTINRSVTAACSTLLNRMMAKSPENRFQSCREVIARIDAITAGTLPAPKKADPHVPHGHGHKTTIQMGKADVAKLEAIKRKQLQTVTGKKRRVSTVAAILVPILIGAGFCLYRVRPSIFKPTPALAPTPLPTEPAKRAPVVTPEAAVPQVLEDSDQTLAFSTASRLPLGSDSPLSAGPAFSPDGRFIAIGFSDGSLSVIDAESRKTIVTHAAHSKGVHDIAFTASGSDLISVSTDGSIQFRSPLEPDAWVSPSEGGPAIHATATSPDGTFLATAGASGTIHLWHGESGAPEGTLRQKGQTQIRALVFSPDRTKLYAAQRDGAIRIWDVELESCIGTLQGTLSPLSDLHLSPNGLWLAAAGETGAIEVWNFQGTGDATALPPSQESRVLLGFLPKSSTLLAARESGGIDAWDLASWTQLHSVSPEPPLGKVSTGTLTVSGGQLALVSDEGHTLTFHPLQFSGDPGYTPPVLKETAIAPFAEAFLAQDTETMQDALKTLKEGEALFSEKELDELESLTAQLEKLPSLLTASFDVQIGERITLELLSGPVEVKPLKIEEDGTVYIKKGVEKNGKIVSTIDTTLALDSLSLQEKLQRLGTQQDPSLNLVRGILALTADEPDQARQYFERSRTEFGTLLLQQPRILELLTPRSDF